MVEALGYIGYFSEAKMLDYPGLVAPEVVASFDQGYDHFTKIALHLRPEWMVLRPWEKDMMMQLEPFRRDYTEVKVFDARPRLAEYPLLPGRPFVEFDAAFHVFKRTG
jgi:hypothetical protein